MSLEEVLKYSYTYLKQEYSAKLLEKINCCNGNWCFYFKSFSIGVSLVFSAPGVRFQNYFSEYIYVPTCVHVCFSTLVEKAMKI